MTFETESFDSRRHRAETFSSGRRELDEWLRHYAGQAQRRDLTRTFVIAGTERSVLGYYALVATEIQHSAATPGVARRASTRFPIPACLLARLAVDKAYQGRKLGSLLLLDSLRRVLTASEQIGMRALVVDAVDDGAASFYRRFGFLGLTDEPRRLQMTIDDIRRVLERH